MPFDPRRVQSIFLEAVKVVSPAHRATLVDNACANNDELRQRVCDLLRMHDLPDNALDTPALDSLGVTPDPDANVPKYFDWGPELRVGSIINGKYRLVERLGEGGMGTVFRAEQISPFRRNVAIKLIRSGIGGRNTITRFASERQALALMDHVNIAKVLDAGLTDGEVNDEDCLEPRSSGSHDTNFLSHEGRIRHARPYFVMELVDGLAITKYCTRHRLSLRQRLELFIPVCHAVQHAHQKGVIHRDLKPGNILVTQRDGQAVPIIIDFGIAKSINTGLGDVAGETAPGFLMGSLDYMAPEQAANDSNHVDTRTDVYALGALLYELLTGCVPLDRDKMRQASVFGIASMICEETPIPPSRRVIAKTKECQAAGLSCHRHSSQLRNDLDWVVMKCLEKAPERRYQTALALADDIQRYLTGEAVLAGAPGAAHVAAKFLRRHYRAVIAASLVILSLAGGLAGMSWGLRQARQAQVMAIEERDDKEVALRNEALQRQIAVKERVRADSEASVAKAVAAFLQNDLLRQADSQFQSSSRFDPDPNLTVRSVLDRAAASVERRFHEQPAVEAAIRRTIGRAYDGLGEFGRAINHLTKCVTLYESLGDAEAGSLEAARYDLGIALRHASRYEESIPLLEKAYAYREAKYGPDHRATWAAAAHLGIAFEKVGRLDDSHRLFNEVYESVRRSDADPASIMGALNNLACLDANRGRLDDAIVRLEELHSKWDQTLGAGAPQKLELLLNLGQMFLRANRFDEAAKILDQARAHAQGRFSAEHPSVLTSCFLLSEAYLRGGQRAEAGQVLEDCRGKCLEKVGPTHVRFHVATIELASWAAETGQLDRAKLLMENTLKALAPVASTSAFTRASAQLVLSRTLFLMQRPAEAEPLARDAMAVFAVRRPDDWHYADARTLLGLILTTRNELQLAEPFLTEGVEGYKRQETQIPHSCRQKYLPAIQALIRCADARDADNDADAWRAEHERVAKIMR